MTGSHALFGGFVCTVAAGAIAAASIPPARAAIIDAMSCAQSAPCLEWDNTGSGDAVKGVSTKGNALHGQTKFKSAGNTTGKAGVFGEDLSTSGNLDAGVSGVSTNGSGVVGTSAAWNGIEGLTAGPGTSGVYGQNSSASGFGVAGRDTGTTFNQSGSGVLADGGNHDDGLHAVSSGSGASAILAIAQDGSSIVASQGPNTRMPELLLQSAGSTVSHDLIDARDPSGNDIFGVATPDEVFAGGNFIGFPLSSGGVAGTFVAKAESGNEALDLFGDNVGSGDDVLDIMDNTGDLETRVTDTGDIWTTGLIHTGGSCGSGCVVGGKRVRSVGEYTPSEAEPTIEDNGEAQLVSGRAYVALDPKFENVIDATSAYLVTVTPEGDCDGLYVTGKTPAGFVVREIHDGRSNVGFAYRIVAKKYGVHARRLPMVDGRRVVAPRMHQGRGGQ
jgi:hypothetical protein